MLNEKSPSQNGPILYDSIYITFLNYHKWVDSRVKLERWGVQGKSMHVSFSGPHEGSLCMEMLCIIGYTNDNILVVILNYIFTKCYHWWKLSKRYMGFLCIFSYNCVFSYNMVVHVSQNKKSNLKRKKDILDFIKIKNICSCKTQLAK